MRRSRRLGRYGQQGTVDDVERPAEFRNIGRRIRIEIGQGELDNRGRVNDPTISLPKATGTCGNGLLPDPKIVAIGTGGL